MKCFRNNKDCLEQEFCSKVCHINCYYLYEAQSIISNQPLKIKLTSKEQAVWDKTNGFCWLCNQPMTYNTFSYDHVIPKSKGGTNDVNNLMPAHRYCNSVRGDKTPQKFLKLLEKIKKRKLLKNDLPRKS